MTPDVRRDLKGFVDELRALAVRLRQHDLPLATQLLEMAVLEIKGRMHGIGDDEFDALLQALAGQASLGSPERRLDQVEPPQSNEQFEVARPRPLARVVAIGEVRRSKRKRLS